MILFWPIKTNSVTGEVLDSPLLKNVLIIKPKNIEAME